MIIINNSKLHNETTITGRIDRFNYDIPSSSWKIFWIDGDNWKSGWCKGKVSGNIKAGDRVKLIGRWQIDERFPDFGLQFFFSSYSILDERCINSNMPDQQKVLGRISRMKDRNGNARIFTFKTENGDSFDCYGRVIRGAEIYADDYLTLYGTFSGNLKQQKNEKTGIFYYTSYTKISPPHKQLPRIERRKTRDPNVLVTLSASLNTIQSYFQNIGQERIEYEFHNPVVNTISRHVRTQLINRVSHSKDESKDLYFLTAFLDRNALDYDVQKFRIECPNFKDELIKCWSESPIELKNATENIKYTIENYGANFCSSPTFKKLYKQAPGPYKLNQILICLKIVNEIFKRDQLTTISQLCSTISKEKALRHYLLNLYGVGHKIANWALTNVTGHWFVIDQHIEKVITRKLKDTLRGLEVSSGNADQIFDNWFGIYDEENQTFRNISYDVFTIIFPDFIARKEYKCLPFIVTQYLWYYGKYFLN